MRSFALLLAPRLVAAVAPVVFPPSQNWDGADGTWSTFSLRVGNPEQVVRVLPSTSAYNTIVQLPGSCNETSDYTTCETSRGGIFDPTQSKTWQQIGPYGIGIDDLLGYGDVGAEFGLDGVGLGITDNANLTFASQVVGGVESPVMYPLGLFGLGTQPTNFTTFANPRPSFFSTLDTQNLIPSFSWSYTAGAHYQLTGVLGTLIFGGYDQSKFTPNNLTIPMSPDVSRDLVVGLQSITASYAAGSKLLLPSGGHLTFVDSTLPYIWLPLDACQAFEKAFGLQWDDDYGLYLVNDTLHRSLKAMNPIFTFTLGVLETGGDTVQIQLPYASFDLTVSPPLVNSTMNYFPIVRATNSTQYTLGRAFLQEAYLIADYDHGNFSLSQNVWVSGASSDIVTISRSGSSPSSGSGSGSGSGGSQKSGSGNASSSVNGGLIGGIVAAVVILILVAIAGLVFWAYKKKKWPFKKPAHELEAGTPNEGTEMVPKTDVFGGDTAFDPMKPLPQEAMGTPRAELSDKLHVPGYFAAKGRHEMATREPTAAELHSPEIHEMFDNSVYVEMHSQPSAQSRSTPTSRTSSRAAGAPAQPFSWMETQQGGPGSPQQLPVYPGRGSTVSPPPESIVSSARSPGRGSPAASTVSPQRTPRTGNRSAYDEMRGGMDGMI